MDFEWITKEAFSIEDEIINHRRRLHEMAEVGFSLDKTVSYVRQELEKLGCEVKSCGKCGLSCTIDGMLDNPIICQNTIINLDTNEKAVESNKRKCVLLRADMDALPINEEADLSFKSKNGRMHACGHDMHTAMLLASAKILVKNKGKFSHTVKLMFQPAEEILEGARDMLDNGILENPTVSCGAMLHVVLEAKLDTGALVFANSGVSSPSSDFFKITITGQSAHGAMPQKAIDPTIPASHIILALESLISHEVNGLDALITIGEVHAGKAPNVIPDKATITGTIRAYNEKTRCYLKSRLNDIVELYAKSHKASGVLEFTSGCPTLVNDKDLIEVGMKATKSAYASAHSKSIPQVLSADSFGARSMASEDFSYISHKIPTIMAGICVENKNADQSYPLHHPKVIFDEDGLVWGTIAYTVLGISLGESNQKKLPRV